MDKQGKESKKTREHILQIACEVFAERGFRTTTVRDICRMAQVNVAAVNYYFSSKEKLYEEVCKYIFGLSPDNADPRFILGDNKNPEEKLHAFIHAMLLTVLARDRSNWREMIMAREMIEATNALTIVIEDMIKPRFQQLYSIVKDLLGEGVEDELVRKCCLSITGQCLYYRFAQPVVLKLNPQQKFDKAGIKELAGHITQFSLQAIKRCASNKGEKE